MSIADETVIEVTKADLIKNNNIKSAIFLLDQKVEPLEFLNRLKVVEKMVDNNAFMIKEMKEKVEKETRKKYRIKIVKNAIKLGMNDEDISKLTGLGIEEISKVRIKN